MYGEVKGIGRMQLKLLSDEEVYMIHLASLDILERIGFKVYEDYGLKLLNEAGALVDYTSKTAKIPEYLLMEMVRKAPSHFTLYGRTGKHEVRLGGSYINFRCGPACKFILDPKDWSRRPATIQDVSDGFRVLDALENIGFLGAPCTPQDVHFNIQLLRVVEEALKNTEKPWQHWLQTTGQARYAIRMLNAVLESEKQVKKRPPFIPIIEVTSPLQLHRAQFQNLYLFASRGLPLKIGPVVIAGATSPVTLAGSLAMGNAMALAGILLAQLIKPGTPVLHWVGPASIDMRTAHIVFGGPEAALMQAAQIQLGRYYGLPTSSISGLTESNIIDLQDGAERMMTTLLPAMAGCNEIGAMGGLESLTSTSFEEFIIDDEIAGIVSRIIQGLTVKDETLAIDVIAKVGFGGEFLSQLHTREFFGREHIMTKLFLRETWDAWRGAGMKSLIDAATLRVKDILKTHQPQPLDTDIAKEIERIRQEAAKELTPQKLPYEEEAKWL